MDDSDGDAVGALHASEQPQQGGDFGAGVLVDAVHAHKRIEHEQAWLQGGEGGLQARLVFGAVEAQAGGCDDVQVEVFDVEPPMLTEASDASPYLWQRILGEVDERGAGLLDLEVVQARGGGGDGDGEVEPQPALAALSRVPDYAASI